MILRNKKTGEIFELLAERGGTHITFNVENRYGFHVVVDCDSITQLNEEWEDYKEPSKPSVEQRLEWLFKLTDEHDRRLTRIEHDLDDESPCKSANDLDEVRKHPNKEPLIKDEKIRKAVRAWADANDIRFGRRCSSLNAYSKRIVGWNALGTTFTIEFDKDLKIYGDNITKDDYTIAELCGEEEE